MAYHHLGQADKAKAEYERAVAQLELATSPEPELKSLRRTAEKLLQGDVELERQ